MNLFKRYLLTSVPHMAEGGGGGGGAPGGGAPGGGAPGGGAPGGGGTPWYESADIGLEPEVKTHIAGKNFPDLKSALRAGMEADTFARSRNVIERPDPQKLADWKHWEDVGWIKDPAKYTLKQPDKDKLPPGIVYEGSLFEEVRKAAHDGRVPLAAAQSIHDAVWNYMVKGVQDLQAKGAKAAQTLETELRGDWGADFDRNSALARRAMTAFNPNKDDTALVGKLMGEPGLVRMFHKIGETIGEASLPALGGGSGGGMGGLPATVAATQAEINRLQGDPAFVAILNDNRHPQHADYTAQRQRLIAHLSRLQGRAA